jgi:hypothetical protein
MLVHGLRAAAATTPSAADASMPAARKSCLCLGGAGSAATGRGRAAARAAIWAAVGFQRLSVAGRRLAMRSAARSLLPRSLKMLTAGAGRATGGAALGTVGGATLKTGGGATLNTVGGAPTCF